MNKEIPIRILYSLRFRSRLPTELKQRFEELVDEDNSRD
jgi:hypothetical protein